MLKKAKWLAKEGVLRIKYMTNSECIFCKIVSGEIKSNIIYKDDTTIAFPDINPIAATHVLIVPKNHIESVSTIGKSDGPDLIAMFNAASKISKEKGIDSFRLSFNAGKFQHVPHLHMHLLAGSKIEWKRL